MRRECRAGFMVQEEIRKKKMFLQPVRNKIMQNLQINNFAVTITVWVKYKIFVDFYYNGINSLWGHM